MPSNTALWFHSLQNVQVLLSYSRNSLVHFIIVKSMISSFCSGPDVVVCDEGHLLKNSKSGIRNAVVQIASKRRVVLTGTPLQNNLKECECNIMTSAICSQDHWIHFLCDLAYQVPKPPWFSMHTTLLQNIFAYSKRFFYKISVISFFISADGLICPCGL